MRIEQLCSDLVMIPRDHLKNLELLIAVLNPIEEVWVELGNNPWKVTSGYRFLDEHVKIYNKINEGRPKKKQIPTPMRSNHLVGNAVDIEDVDQQLKFFVADHLELFEDAQIYFEAFANCPNWLHMQRVPPKSGKRFFVPF